LLCSNVSNLIFSNQHFQIWPIPERCNRLETRIEDHNAWNTP
jgi:hypothetical protein